MKQELPKVHLCALSRKQVPMATLDMRLLAERLRTTREAQGFSQTALAERAALNLGNVNEL